MPGFQKLQAALPLADIDLHHVKADGVPPVRPEILSRRVHDALPLAVVHSVNRLFPRGAGARLDFHKTDHGVFLGNQVDFTAGKAVVLLQNGVTVPEQRLPGGLFPKAADFLLVRGRFGRVLLLEIFQEGDTVYGAGPLFPNGLIMGPGGIPLVLFKAVAGIFQRKLAHHGVPAHLGQHRGRCNAGRGGVSLDDLAPHCAKGQLGKLVPVDKYQVRLRGQRRDGAAHGKQRGL